MTRRRRPRSCGNGCTRTRRHDDEGRRRPPAAFRQRVPVRRSPVPGFARSTRNRRRCRRRSGLRSRTQRSPRRWRRRAPSSMPSARPTSPSSSAAWPNGRPRSSPRSARRFQARWPRDWPRSRSVSGGKSAPCCCAFSTRRCMSAP